MYFPVIKSFLNVICSNAVENHCYSGLDAIYEVELSQTMEEKNVWVERA